MRWLFCVASAKAPSTFLHRRFKSSLTRTRLPFPSCVFLISSSGGNFFTLFKKEMSQPTRWPFAAASGFYLALIAKNHFSLSPEAAEHSRTHCLFGLFCVSHRSLARVFSACWVPPRWVMSLNFDCCLRFACRWGSCACDCRSGCPNAILSLIHSVFSFFCALVIPRILLHRMAFHPQSSRISHGA
jgi:hypothetical protein